MTTQHMIHQLQQFIAALKQHDMGIIVQLYSENATIEGRVCSMYAFWEPGNMTSK